MTFPVGSITLLSWGLNYSVDFHPWLGPVSCSWPWIHEIQVTSSTGVTNGAQNWSDPCRNCWHTLVLALTVYLLIVFINCGTHLARIFQIPHYRCRRSPTLLPISLQSQMHHSIWCTYIPDVVYFFPCGRVLLSFFFGWVVTFEGRPTTIKCSSPTVPKRSGATVTHSSTWCEFP